MPSYSRAYLRLAERAVTQGKADLTAFVDQMRDAGTSLARIEELLMQDIEEGGPIFGKFFRGLSGAAQQTALEASRQGAVMADVQKVAAKDPAIASAFATQLASTSDPAKLAEIRGKITDEELLQDAAQRAIDEADPEELARIEELAAPHVLMMWTAAMRKTCHLCLPLHGKVLTLREWRELGETPGQVHSKAGWTSPCYCKFVEVGHLSHEEFLERKNAVKNPLVRNAIKVKDKDGKLVSTKRTARGVSQNDVAKSIQAHEQAMQSIEGRRTMRLLGSVGGNNT